MFVIANQKFLREKNKKEKQKESFSPMTKLE